MANFKQRLKALEQRVIEAMEPEPAIVQIIYGTRTPEQQTEYEQAIADGVLVIEIGVKDCSKAARNEH